MVLQVPQEGARDHRTRGMDKPFDFTSVMDHDHDLEAARRGMTSISKSKLKANVLRVFREIEQSGEERIVTDHNRPVLRIQPIDRKKTVEELFGKVQGKVIYHEDVHAPTTAEWAGSQGSFWTLGPDLPDPGPSPTLRGCDKGGLPHRPYRPQLQLARLSSRHLRFRDPRIPFRNDLVTLDRRSRSSRILSDRWLCGRASQKECGVSLFGPKTGFAAAAANPDPGERS